MRMALVIALVLLLPATAQAGVVTVDGSTLRYDAAAGDAEDLSVRRTGTDLTVTRLSGAPLSEASDQCTIAVDVVTCTGANDLVQVLVTTLDGDDRVGFNELGTITAVAELGTGSDAANVIDQAAQPFRVAFRGGAGSDFLSGGLLADALDGGGDEDLLDGGGGPDDLRGGTGFDEVLYSGAVHNGGVSVTLDDVSDDGRPGEQDNARSDIEAVEGTEENDVLVGNAVSNVLVGMDGDDQITGAGGADVLVGDDFPFVGEQGNDTIFARDGVVDFVSCGLLTDTAETDDIDETSGCETENSAPVAGPPPNPDADGDGFAAHRECDDARADVYPGAPDALANDVDEDCDGRDVPEIAFKARAGKTTRFKKLRVVGLLAGDSVQISGRPRRCRIRTRTITAKSAGGLSIAGRAPRRLRPGCVVTIRISRGDRSIAYELRARKRKQPLQTRL